MRALSMKLMGYEARVFSVSALLGGFWGVWGSGLAAGAGFGGFEGRFQAVCCA
jgi:hypothetical protein